MTEFKDHQRELHSFRRRISIAAVFVVVTFSLLLLRFVYLQIVQYNYYHTKAEDNRISIVPIAPNRGLILDRNGAVLARNYSAYTLEISPEKVTDLGKTIDELGTIVDIRASDRIRFKRLMIEDKGADSVPIRTHLTDEEVARFAVNRYRFPGVDIKARLYRQYPLKELASHVIGYIGRINDRDAKRIDDEGLAANYRGTDHIGKTGLEQSYEDELHGTTGYEQVEVDSAGRRVRTLSRTPATPGDNLVLTLDVNLQRVADQAFGDHRGALVAIDPATGGILAFVSKPGFDPNLFVDGIDPASWDALNNSPDRPMVDRALAGVYPPGSTFKPYLALAALELGVRTPQYSIHDPGYFQFGGHIFHDDKPGGHGVVDMYKALVVSCDTYFYMLANDLGIENIAHFVGQFGFGAKTGIDIEGESTGVLPSPEWKRRHFKKREQQKWYAGETISVGIGQGYNAYTPLQMALAMATLADNGVMYRPHLVDYIENPKTGERTTIEPTIERTIRLKPENLAFVKRALAGVDIEGTGARAFANAEYTSAGKTGTAQVVALKPGEKYDAKDITARHRDNALFIAFAPLQDPKIALAVVVENAGFGATAAAPIARQVLDYYLLGKTADKPAAEVQGGESGD
ncbi:MAG TPA: penicillin-binding protein 2 [Burkholderiales bacterium]|nr:penicillin-binding protein 2 [Burkholderiales bacterium]